MNEPDLRTRLEELSVGLPDRDLVEQAWAGGLEERRRARRRVTIAGLAVACGAAILAGLAARAPSPPEPAPATQGTTRPAPEDLVHRTTLLRTPVDVLPRSAQLDRLPAYPDAERVALTPDLVEPRGRVAGRLSELGAVDHSVRAVMLRVERDGSYRPVLLVPSASPDWVEVDTVTLTGAEGAAPSWPALDGDWINPDRRRVAFPQSRGVAVVDLRTGSTSTVAIADDITDVGWLGDGTLLVTGEAHAWVVDGAQVRRARPGLSSRPERLTSTDQGGLVRESYAGDGSPAGVVELSRAWSSYGTTVSDIEGWSASTVFCTDPGCDAAGVPQGVYAVQVDGVPRGRVLATSVDDDTWKAGLTPLTWGPQGHLLVLSSSATGSRVLAWDVHEGEVYRVVTLAGVTPPGDDPQPGDLLPVLAL